MLTCMKSSRCHSSYKYYDFHSFNRKSGLLKMSNSFFLPCASWFVPCSFLRMNECCFYFWLRLVRKHWFLRTHLYSQFLPKSSDFGLRVGQLYHQVLLLPARRVVSALWANQANHTLLFLHELCYSLQKKPDYPQHVALFVRGTSLCTVMNQWWSPLKQSMNIVREMKCTSRWASLWSSRCRRCMAMFLTTTSSSPGFPSLESNHCRSTMFSWLWVSW